MPDVEVQPVGEARAGFTGTIRRFREDPEGADAIVIGSHRRPDAVLMPYAHYRRLLERPPAPAGPRARLREHSSLIERLARLNRIADVRVFGSVARGDDRAASDVDLLVTPEDGASLFDLVRFGLDMEAFLERRVDVVSSRALDPTRDAAILAEAVPL